MSDLPQALQAYAMTTSNSEDKKAVLTAIQEGSQTTLDLSDVDIVKLRQRFGDASLTDINPNAITIGIELLKNTHYGDNMGKTLQCAWIAIHDESYAKIDVAEIDKDVVNDALMAYTNTDSIWHRADCYQVLLFIYGAERIDSVEQAWQDTINESYQTGWQRRSFRSHADDMVYFEKRITLLKMCTNDIVCSYSGYRKPNVCLDVPKLEQVRWDWQLWKGGCYKEWAGELNLTDDLNKSEMFILMQDIVYNRDDVGKVSSGIIKALLSCKHESAWALVKDLLLAAQRQEGLRQTILEALDECHPQAIPYFIDVIVEHNLTRFSSVVRAIDTWTGMMWEADKATACKKFLQSAQAFFNDPKLLSKKIDSHNNLEVFSALWVASIDNIYNTVPMIERLIATAKPEKFALAMYFIRQSQKPQLEIPLYMQALAHTELMQSTLAIGAVTANITSYRRHKVFIQNYAHDFNNIYQNLDDLLTTHTQDRTFTAKVFNWLNFNYKTANVQQIMSVIACQDMTIYTQFMTNHHSKLAKDVRENMASVLLNNFNDNVWNLDKKWCVTERGNASKELTSLQRHFALTTLDDRAELVGNYAISALASGKLHHEDMSNIVELSSKKGKTIAKRLLYVMLAQPTTTSINLIEQLIYSNNTQHRVFALELAHELIIDASSERISSAEQTQINKWIDGYIDTMNTTINKKPTKAEQQWLDMFAHSEDEPLSYHNGWGLFDPQQVSAYETPVFDKESLFASITHIKDINEKPKLNTFGLSKPSTAITADLQQLITLFNNHQDYEYETEYWDGSKETVLLGNSFRSTKTSLSAQDGQQYVESYPLWQTWRGWYSSVAWTAQDLFLLTLDVDESSWWRDDNNEDPRNLLKNTYSEFFVKANTLFNELDNPQNVPLERILQMLKVADPYQKRNDYVISASQALYASFDDSIINWKRPQETARNYYSCKNHNGWQSLYNARIFLKKIDSRDLTEQQTIAVWHLYRWRQMTGLAENVRYLQPPFWLICKAYALKIITDNELMAGLVLNDDALRSISTLDTEAKSEYQRENRKEYYAWLDDAPILTEILTKISKHCLEIELKRGELVTPVTQITSQVSRFNGMKTVFKAFDTLGKAKLYAYRIWSVENGTKREMMSYIIGRTYPLATDDQALFNSLVKAHALSDERVLQMAIYAPQWQDFAQKYLQWEGLSEGIWWMNAHTKTSEYEAKSSQEESEIARYSTINLNEFTRGAVDIEWFHSAYGKLGKKRWEMLYDCAKFISEGNGHRRAKLYSDVLTNTLKIREVSKKVKEKRDQDHLRLYGLVPLSKTNAQKDVLARYTYLQQFKKESKQFGSQRQTSEGLAVQVAMDNLARTAGFPDPLRLGWAMESKTVQAIFDAGTHVYLYDTLVELVIEDTGKTDIRITKDEKIQKSIPHKYKKHPDVLTLKQHKKTLNEQYRRAKISLEDAMVRGDVFTWAELVELYAHPVISKLLSTLLFVTDDADNSLDDNSNDSSADSSADTKISHQESFIKQIGFIREEDTGFALADSSHTQCVMNNNSTLRIAHCVDLHQSTQANATWHDWQSYCFNHTITQPFKQVFRELYLPNADELAETAKSSRYAGHQVQPAKTVALLKNRGWKVDYEEGLQKVYHKAGFKVKLYAMADWFSPADTESPTLETIEFHRLSVGNNESYNIPLAEIDARIFSEVMRDIDLVVSVAHVGDVDPEASQSSIELRSVLLKETLRLFKLDNVDVKGNHAIIQGTLAKYSVHLGSAVVHQVTGSYLSILPVHAGHRGRIFLPFMDEDPKTAELMAKVLMLAKDNDIQDPTVLSQISLKG